MDRIKAMTTFVRIGRSRSLSSAARSIGITRALASVHLKQLEDHLGVRLLNRTTRQISLTEAGTEYLEFCADILEKLDHKEVELARGQVVPQGHLKILASSAFAEFVLAPIVAQFAAAYPEISISLMTGTTHALPQEMLELGYDLGITMHPVEEVSMVIAKLGEVHWRPYASPDYLQALGAPATPADLTNHACLSHRSISPDWVWRFNGPGGPTEIKVSGPLFTNNVIILREFVMGGCGISLLPSYAAKTAVERGELVELLLDYTAVSRNIYAVYSSAKYLPKKIRLFLDFMRSHLHRNLAGRLSKLAS
jgi:DNA-binding transcriptional LysR family regulator